MNDLDTEIQTRAERAFLAALEGGCQVPIGALAMMEGVPTLHGFISDIDGRQDVRGSVTLDRENPGSERRRAGEAASWSRRDRDSGRALGKTDKEIGAQMAPSPQPEFFFCWLSKN